MSALAFELPARARGDRAARGRAACAATTCACWSPRADRPLEHARFRDLPDATSRPATCSSSTPRRRCPPRSPRALATDGGRAAPRRRRTRRRPRTARARWVVELRRGGEPLPAAAPARRSRSPAAAALELLAPYLAPGAPVDRAARPRRRRWTPTSPRHGAPIRYAHAAARLAARRLPDDLRRRARQRRDAERRPPVHARASSPPCARAASASRRSSLHTGVSLAGARRARRTPSATAVPAATARLAPCNAGAAA